MATNTQQKTIVHRHREAEPKTHRDVISGRTMRGWFYAGIWLAPEDDPERALRTLKTLDAFFASRELTPRN